MAHELAFTNGRADMLSVRQTPWHAEGWVLGGAPGFEEALRLAGLDYEIVKEPTWHRDLDGSFVANESAWTTRRRDTGAELGMVGPDYEPVQNRTAFEVFAPLLDQGLATIETAGVLRAGADAWMLVRWAADQLPERAKQVYGALGVTPYALVSTNHTGRRGVLLQDTPIRVVCANTLGAAEGFLGTAQEYRAANAIVVRHTKNADSKLLDAARDLWAGVGTRHEAIAAQYDALRSLKLSLAQFLDTVVPLVAEDPRGRAEFNPDAKLATLVVERWERKRDRLVELWRGGEGHTGDESAWEAYNGVAEAIDHDRELFPVRAGTYRTASLLGGRLRDIKSRVLTQLTAMAVADA